MSSECPGWVCYLEKVLGQKFIKFASRVKPPQLVGAAIARSVFSRMNPPVDPSKMFIGLIAPCFDKKLEAAREEVRKEFPVIDLVLSSGEIHEYMSKEILDFPQYFQKFVRNKKFVVDFGELLIHPSLQHFSSAMPSLSHFALEIQKFQIKKGFDSRGESNGYLSFILSKSENIKEIKYRKIKTKNFTEVKVEYKSGESNIFAYVYGFKNIQNLIRKIKMKKCKYKYVEIMACPSGCINGGGQISLKKPELEILSEESSKFKKFYDFSREISKLENLIKLEKKGPLSSEGLGYYEIEPIEEKDPLKIKW